MRHTLLIASLLLGALQSGCVYRDRMFVSAGKEKGPLCQGWQLRPSILALQGSRNPDPEKAHRYSVWFTGWNLQSDLRMRIDSVYLEFGNESLSARNRRPEFADSLAGFQLSDTGHVWIPPEVKNARARVGVTFMPKEFDRTKMRDTVIEMPLRKRESAFVSFPSY